jgi:hypothetical protein
MIMLRWRKRAMAKRNGSGFRFGFAQTGNAVAIFALAALLQKLSAFKALENIAFTAKSGSGAQATML